MLEGDRRHLTHAISLGQRGLGRTWPNPAVGCVIVAGDRIIGRGWTQPGGRPHAETIALTQAGPAARGATAYVSLEPCAHHGRTPPCCDALIAAGVARVVVPMQDPDPRVAGEGLRRLRAAGIEVVIAHDMADTAREANAGFLMRQATGRPLVTLKLATSLDGRIATARGESRWITGPEARTAVHLMRAQSDALLIGAGTARADDPMLDVRIPGLGDASPLRVIADGSLSLPLTGRLARSIPSQPVWLMHRRDADRTRRKAWEGLGALTFACPTDDTGALIPAGLLDLLGENGVTRVLCEGGGRLAASLLRAGLVDRLVYFHAGLVMGAEALASIAALPDEPLPDMARWTLVRSTPIGPDVMSEWRI
ncbi:bifunctional diaminohydroxyphosphoribosylaminopyrimidine deaminase/5-amino-6-(5-phosphoribosylamino)uracil reductase RibD [Pontivivens nitratireducens]|uniref:Riboflavin biosynthesis protein RibD n=1 Tax=Pontivivens nitratireducens TaxID=2758038 RepID=A0A6G7VPG4_9RHOB|nr:bifunctional diaminohydroxyphosphoribosylaminopyrimidine deaminase/5-amino-6-(5-phosphoribosylamino)uracil reductase RibD [Pontibrevibacter nitratireducens]QIK41677.1 bifunctional diaminohydroxyphosphoribosylaminopyrimidine deaminase/5-amino-6-(5-phosphoribosylamino)uracil reductase RibD [Pontibrevibacter nitratireducens]